MKYDRVLLISPNYGDVNSYPEHPASGLGYIAHVLKRNKIYYEVFDMGLNYSLIKLLKKINQYKPDLIAVTMVTFSYKNTYSMFEKVKLNFPDIPIVVGGPHISTFREEALKDCKAIDFGIVLEGDESMIELCLGKEPGEIKGLIYRKNGEVLFDAERNFILDLDSMGFPEYTGFEFSKYSTPGVIPIVTSRGCPYDCIYCPSESAIGKKFRQRSPQNMFDEINYWYKRGYTSFKILDDNFTLMKDRVNKFCELIEKSDIKNIKFALASGIRADKIDRELLERLKNIGVYSLAFGVEAGNNKILKNIKKNETIEEIRNAIKDACEIGLNVHLYFIIGSPGETREDIEDSVKLSLDYPISYANFYNLIPYPKTELFEWVKENKYFVREPNEYLNDTSCYYNNPCISTPELNFEERKKVFEYLHNIAKEIKRRNVYKRLKRYFGIFGYIISLIYMSDFFQYFFKRNRFIMRFVYSIKHRLKLEK